MRGDGGEEAREMQGNIRVEKNEKVRMRQTVRQWKVRQEQKEAKGKCIRRRQLPTQVKMLMPVCAAVNRMCPVSVSTWISLSSAFIHSFILTFDILSRLR